MVKEKNYFNRGINLSIVLGSTSVFGTSNWLLQTLNYNLTNPVTSRQIYPIQIVLAFSLVGAGLILLILIYSLKSRWIIRGGIGMGLLGFVKTRIAVQFGWPGVFKQVRGIEPNGPDYLTFIRGFLLFAGRLLVILVIFQEFQLKQEKGGWRITGHSPRYLPKYSPFR